VKIDKNRKRKRSRKRKPVFSNILIKIIGGLTLSTTIRKERKNSNFIRES
jgi:hypothetical protein